MHFVTMVNICNKGNIKFLKNMFGSCFSRRQFSISLLLHTGYGVRFVQFVSENSVQKLGVQKPETGEIIDITGSQQSFPDNLVQFLANEATLSDLVKRAVKKEKKVYQLSDVKLLAPVTKPDKIICVGLNYKGHCDEQKKPYPEEPFFFAKFPSTIVGPDGNVTHPSNTKALDWEVELAVIIGKTAKHVKTDHALDYVFGYTVSQDISARDWQTPKRNNGQWLIAKSMDTFCPLGPVIVTKDEIPDPHTLNISCSINGVQKQNANTNELIHRVDKLVSFLSDVITLLPGDIILTGTPSGVGVFRNPREFLKPGDVIESEISGIGKLKSHII